MGMKSTNGLALLGSLWITLCTAMTEVSLAVTVPVTLDLWPPHGRTNVLEITSTAEIDYFAGMLDAEDVSSVAMTGRVTADLEIHFDPEIPHILDIRAIELTGGNIKFEDVAIELDFSLFGGIQADVTSLAAIPQTPSPDGGVDDGMFDASEHALITNKGLITVSGTGLIGALYLDPISMDLSEHPIDLGPTGTGFVDAVLLDIDHDWAAYEVVLTLPVDWDVVTSDQDGTRLTVEGVGTIGARGHFAVPEPATVALLALGALVLRRRRTNIASSSLSQSTDRHTFSSSSTSTSPWWWYPLG